MSAAVITLDSTVIASADQVSADLNDEVVVLNLKNGEYYSLNEVGARVWALIQEPRSLVSVRDELVREYVGADPEVCARDVLALAEQLASVALIDVVFEQGL